MASPLYVCAKASIVAAQASGDAADAQNTGLLPRQDHPHHRRGSGIGRATALIFAREGANVVCADINEAGVKETAEKVNAIGSQALALTIDVTKRAAVNDMVELAVNGFGRIDFLFNSAGAALKRAKFLEIDDDLLERTFDLNFKGTLVRDAGGAAAHAQEQGRRDRQCRQHGGQARRARHLDPLRRRQGRGEFA